MKNLILDAQQRSEGQGKPQKKFFLLVARTLRPYPRPPPFVIPIPIPSSLVGTISGWVTKKRTLFAATPS